MAASDQSTTTHDSAPLSKDELHLINAYWRACNYLAAGMIYLRDNHPNLHVRGYKEKGSINTPLELAIQNETDRFSLAINAINRLPGLQVSGAHVKQKLRDQQIECCNYAYEHGIDRLEEDQWQWPY